VEVLGVFLSRKYKEKFDDREERQQRKEWRGRGREIERKGEKGKKKVPCMAAFFKEPVS
jgi:hypothetical protein